MKKLILLLLLFVGAMAKLSAQRIEGRLNLSDTTQVHQLVLIDGSVIVGRLIVMHAETWEFKYSGKVEQIPTNKIERLKVINKGKTDGNNDVVIMESVNPTNNGNSEVLVSPTAIPLKNGDAYYETIWGLYHYVEYGLGKGFSLGIGGFLPALVTRLRWGMPISKNIHVGISNTNYSTLSDLLVWGNRPPSNAFHGVGTLGIVSGNITFGETNRFFNIGIGSSYTFVTRAGYLSGSSLPIISFGGALPIAKRFAVLSDNIIVAGGRNSGVKPIFPSIALRYFNKAIRVDAGLGAILLEFSNNNGPGTSNGSVYFPIPIPYLSFATNFKTN